MHTYSTTPCKGDKKKTSRQFYRKNCNYEIVIGLFLKFLTVFVLKLSTFQTKIQEFSRFGRFWPNSFKEISHFYSNKDDKIPQHLKVTFNNRIEWSKYLETSLTKKKLSRKTQIYAEILWVWYSSCSRASGSWDH